MDTSRLIYLHGLESDSNSGKAHQFREWFSGMLAPNFNGSFEERMIQLDPIHATKIIGLSLARPLADLWGPSTLASMP
jgi:predicted esterase YcpF (UPF0227 family)